MRLLVWMLIGLAASECVSAALDSTSAAVSTSVYDAVGERRLATGLKRNRASVSRRRKTSNANRRARSKLAKSCGGQVGSVLLEEWFRFCQLVFTASVEDIDRERGTVRVSMRRVIRSLSNVSDWTVASFLSPRNQNQPSLAGQSNALDPLPAVDTTDNPLIKPTLILHDLFDARENSCVPQFRIRIHDVLLFLVQIHPLNQTLHLVSAPLRITLRNLKLIHTSPGSPSSVKYSKEKEEVSKGKSFIRQRIPF
ncbi:Uncharacterized protein APZ42_021355 [Daphnia magna]|uniref:Uncharacterized protein n=1 Tax=Daphnia magna TaxID=35525 RepID=A0A164WRD3_9CRUS|nr:Uncharacterized protein APZ42_021355 [Daphnia magna]